MLSSLSIIGLGKLGAPMTACFAARGFTVHAVDLNPQKVGSIARGVSPVNEPGLAELLAESGGRKAPTIWHGHSGRLDPVMMIPFPDSVGYFYSEFTQFLGFQRHSDEWKVMGLAP